MAYSILGGYVGHHAPDASESFYSLAGGIGDATNETEQVVAWPTGIATGCVSGFAKLAVRIDANECDQDSVFNFRVDALVTPYDTTLEVTVPAGETGWFLPAPLGPHDASVGLGGPGHPDRNLVVRLNKPGAGLLVVGAVFLQHEFQHLADPVGEADGTVMALGGCPRSSYGGFSGDYEVRLVGSFEDQDPAAFRHVMRTAGKAHRLRVCMTANSRDVDLVLSLAVNGVASGLTVTIPAADVVPVVYIDSTNVVDLVNGDTLSMILSNPGYTSGSTTIATWELLVETPTATFDVVTGADPGLGTVDIFAPDVTVPLTTGTQGFPAYTDTPARSGALKNLVPVVDFGLSPRAASLSNLRVGYDFFGYDPGVNDLAWFVCLYVNGAPTALRIDVPTPAELVGDFAANGWLEDSTHRVNVAYGDDVQLVAGLTNPELSSGSVGVEFYPNLAAFTVGAPFPDVTPPDPPAPPRYRMQLAVN